MATPISVLVVDDDSMVRAGLRFFVEADEAMVVVGEAADGLVAVQMASSLQPDVVLLDLQMPRLSGPEAAPQIREVSPGSKILALTAFGSAEHVEAMVRGGANGYVLKDSQPEEIVRSIRHVHGGGTALSEDVQGAVLSALRASQPAVRVPQSDETLSTRELDVVTVLAQGLSNREIAAELHLSEATVKAHLGRVMSKWHLRSRSQVILRAVSLGLVAVP